MRAIGVDGYRGGWIAIIVEDGSFVDAVVCDGFGELMAEHAGGAAIVAVDMPIGLIESGDREADTAARARLPAGAKSSVFQVPPRSVVACRDNWDAASAEARVAWGKGIAKQTFQLFGKILQVDVFAGDERVREVHPELSFELLAGDEGGVGRKKTWGGMNRRWTLLADAGIHIPADLGPANHVPPDDILDAGAAAWSALRIACGVAERFPANPTQRDRSGRAIVIEA